jgi:UDP-2-acetamido-3-amino-2,3-dideoxy-glucuronate N-acetyltransferase
MIHPSAKIHPSAYVAADASIGEGASIGPNAAILGAEDDGSAAGCRIAERVVVGANAVLMPGTTVALAAQIRPGSVVQGAVPARAIVGGNPGRVLGYVDSSMQSNEHPLGPSTLESRLVRGVQLVRFKSVIDMRGNLTVGNFPSEVPFTPSRYFLVYGVPSAETRGEHAHRVCHQFLVCVSGHVNVVVDDGHAREEYFLDQPALGLYLPPMTWGIQYKYSQDAVLLVFASHPYDAQDYIRDYSDFLASIASGA